MTNTTRTITPFADLKRGDRVQVIVEGVVDSKWAKSDVGGIVADEFQVKGIGSGHNYIRPDANTVINVLTEVPELVPGMVLRMKTDPRVGKPGPIRIAVESNFKGKLNLITQTGSGALYNLDRSYDWTHDYVLIFNPTDS